MVGKICTTTKVACGRRGKPSKVGKNVVRACKNPFCRYQFDLTTVKPGSEATRITEELGLARANGYYN